MKIFTLYDELNKLLIARGNSSIRYKPEKGKEKIIKVYYQNKQYFATITGKDNKTIKTRKTPIKSIILDLIKDSLDKEGEKEAKKTRSKKVIRKSKKTRRRKAIRKSKRIISKEQKMNLYPDFDFALYNQLINDPADFRLGDIDLSYLRSIPTMELYESFYYSFEKKGEDMRYKRESKREFIDNYPKSVVAFLPNSIDNIDLYMHIYNKLESRFSLSNFISAYKKTKKPKDIVNPQLGIQNLIDIILKYQNLGKKDKKYKLLIVSIIFLYHTADQYGFKGLGVEMRTFKMLDSLVKRIYKQGLPFESMFGTNLVKNIGKDIVSILDRYNKKSKEELVYDKVKIINELNYFIRKVNTTTIKEIEKNRQKLQENIFDDERDKPTKIIEEIKDMRVLKNIYGDGSINLWTYTRQILICNTYIELYIKNTRQLNEDTLSKIKFFFTKNIGFSTSKENKKHNYDFVINQLKRKEVIIKRMRSLLFKVEKNIAKISQIQGGFFSKMAKYTLAYKGNPHLQEIILYYNETIIKPQLANNVIIYQNILGIIQKYKKYCEVLQNDLEKQNILIRSKGY